MKSFIAMLLVSCASVACAGETLVPVPNTDPKSHRELKAQTHDIKHKSRVERASAHRRFYARKLETQAKALRNQNAEAQASIGVK